MRAQPARGRRRDTSAVHARRMPAGPAPRHLSRPRAGDSAGRRRHRPAGVTLGAAVLAAAALTGAHADTSRHGAATAPMAESAWAAVQAPASAALTFDRSPVSTKPAAGGTAAEAISPSAAGPAPGRLSAPLASMAVASPFGLRTSPVTGRSGEFHTGLDLAASCQTAVFSAGAGTVVEAGWSPYGGGNRIVVDHGNGLKSTYNHLSSIETTVGATVGKGQRLAGAGTTGNSTGCHLHFEVLFNGLTVNPQGWV